MGLVSVSYAQENKTKQESPQETSIDSRNLIAILDTIRRLDQEPLIMRDSMGKIYGPESEEAQFYQRIAWKNHPSNIKKVKEILGKKNWPDTTLIGQRGNQIICTILQHSDLETREHYIPRMKQAVLDKKLEARWLVRAEDRIRTDKGELQMYGGQMKWYPETKTFNVWPVYDPANVDKRRAEIGLVPIAEWLKNRFDFEWNLDEQIKRSEEFEREKLRKN
ncbi:MAG: hypothetical protein Sapg2KO_45380 [Saprospiraceae bacterium]